MFVADILDQGAASDYARVQERFSDPSLRVSWRAQLRDERLIGEGVELGDDVMIEKGAAILGRSRILRSKKANEMVEDEDEILIYYGGGDQVVGVAWAKLSALIPSTGKAS